MRDLSLHILDLMENSLRAQATLIVLHIEKDRQADIMRIRIEDNGQGLRLAPEEATDPFRTTKTGRRIGLGLSLFKAAAERADGCLDLRRSDLGGLAVEACFRLSHVDRTPLGSIPDTASSILCAAHDLTLRCRFAADSLSREVDSAAVREHLGGKAVPHLAVAAAVADEVRAALLAVGIDES